MSTAVYTGQNLYIRPTYIVSLPEYHGDMKKRSHRQIANQSNLKNNEHKGKLSAKAATKLKNAINWLIASAKYKRVVSKEDQKAYWFKVNFITLTIPPQQVAGASEKEVKKALHSWLQYARKYFYLKNYVWKFESHKDGRLHIHLTSDTFINHHKLRSSWNRILQSNGLLNAHYSRGGVENPNSTDIHAVRNVNNLAGYLTAYLLKKTDLSEGFKGRIWGCNYELSSENKCTLNLDASETPTVMRVLADHSINYRTIWGKPDSLGNVRRLGEVFFIKSTDWARNLKGKIKQCYDDHRYYIRHNLFKPPPEYFTY